MAIVIGLLAGWFIFSLYYHSQNPPTMEEMERDRENRKKAAMFIGTTAASTSYHLVKKKEKK